MTVARARSFVAVAAFAAACGGNNNPSQPTPVAPAPPAPPTLSTQNPVGSTSNVEARTSQIAASGGPGTEVFDDFVFTAGATIRTVGWQGIQCSTVLNGPAPPATATGFVVAFYPDSGGRPNVQAPLQSNDFSLAQVNQTFERNQSPLNCGTTPTTWSFYSYTATLPAAFSAAAGTRYWLSVRARVPTQQPFWGWRDGTPDNRTSLQLVGSEFTAFQVDRAYSLQ